MRAPFLQKVGVALSLPHDLVKRVVLEPNALCGGGLGDGGAGVCGRERPDLFNVEEPLGVGLGAAHLAAELRQPCADHRHRQLALRDAVQRGDQRRQLLFVDVLQLVDEERHSGLRLLRRPADKLEQLGQIHLQIAKIGDAGFSGHIKADLNVIVFHLHGADEAGETAHRSSGKVFRRAAPREAEQRLAQGRRETRRQGSVFRRLHCHGGDAVVFGVAPHSLQQHGLAHAAQADQDDALARASVDAAAEGEPSRVQHGFAPGPAPAAALPRPARRGC